MNSVDLLLIFQELRPNRQLYLKKNRIFNKINKVKEKSKKFVNFAILTIWGRPVLTARLDDM